MAVISSVINSSDAVRLRHCVTAFFFPLLHQWTQPYDVQLYVTSICAAECLIIGLCCFKIAVFCHNIRRDTKAFELKTIIYKNMLL